MKIVKYRKSKNGKYKVKLDNESELELYEEVILKYELLLKKEVLEDDIIQIEKFNQECDVYYVALKSINDRFKSVFDTKEFLLKKQYPIELIDKAIDKLMKQGYLNDRSFSKSYINHQIITTTKGPNKISRELSDKKIDSNIIMDEIVVFTEEMQLEKIHKLISRFVKSNRTRGGQVLKKKIRNDLINLGYDNNLISKVIDDFEFPDQSDIATKEYEKLYRRLSKKYQGKELEYKIKEKLYQKGLYYEE